VQPEGEAYWVYRKGEAHGEPIGTVDDIEGRKIVRSEYLKIGLL
jgi:hypothetical protein